MAQQYSLPSCADADVFVGRQAGREHRLGRGTNPALSPCLAGTHCHEVQLMLILRQDYV